MCAFAKDLVEQVKSDVINESNKLTLIGREFPLELGIVQRPDHEVQTAARAGSARAASLSLGQYLSSRRTVAAVICTAILAWLMPGGCVIEIRVNI